MACRLWAIYVRKDNDSNILAMIKQLIWTIWTPLSAVPWKAVQFKGAVSYRFSQGLLTLMCNNSKLKADSNFFFFCCVDKHFKSIAGCKKLWFNTRWLCYSVWGKTPVFRNSGFNSETILPFSIFLFDDDTYMPSPQNGIRVCQLELYFWKYFIFYIKYIFFPVFSFSSYHR